MLHGSRDTIMVYPESRKMKERLDPTYGRDMESILYKWRGGDQ